VYIDSKALPSLSDNGTVIAINTAEDVLIEVTITGK